MMPEVQKCIEYASGYLDLKMYDDAMREADKALALAPDLPQAIAIKSDALCQANRLIEAEPFMAQLAELNPRNSAIWINLAYIRRRTKSLDAAVDTLQHAFDADPQDAQAHYNMACYRAVQHRQQEAIDLLQNALHLDPKLKALAKAEPDFAGLREVAAFQKLLGSRGFPSGAPR
jgi:tetratricopeptide (TPR) repeat protein